ncbi:hypothetical protein [Thermodesulfovibrio sp. TK110]
MKTKATVKSVITQQEWQQISDVYINFPGMLRQVRYAMQYSGRMISNEDIEYEAIMIVAEALLKCKNEKQCSSCAFLKCSTFEGALQREAQRRFQKQKVSNRKYAIVPYIENDDGDNGEKHRLATYKNPRYTHQLCVVGDVDGEDVDGEEEFRQEREALKEKIERCETLSGKERKAWELFLAGYDIQVVMQKLGYAKKQGVYMLIKRSLIKIRSEYGV